MHRAVPVGAFKYTDLRRLARFGVVGIAGTMTFYAVLWVLVELVHVGVLSATSIAFVIVCIQNYALHYVWTFNSGEAHAVALPRFLLMSLLGFGLNWTIMYVGVEKMAVNYLLTQALAIIAVVTWNFLLSSFWIFRKSTRAGSPEGKSARAC